MADDKTEYDDYWMKAVRLFTGYEAPPRNTLFDEITGNHGIKQMKVEVSKQDSVDSVTGHEYDWMAENAGWDINNTDFVIPFYTSGGYEGVTYYKARFTLLGAKIANGEPVGGEVVGGEGKSNYGKELEDGHFKPSDDGTVWNTLALTKYSYGTGHALSDLLEKDNGTLGFSWGGEPPIDLAKGVRLKSFDMAADAFDRVAKFLWDSKTTMDEWQNRVGTEQSDAWLGQAAGVFWDLIHELRRRYDHYADDMEAVGGVSKQGRALRQAGQDLRTQAQNLHNKWDYWNVFEGNPLRWLVDLLAEIATNSWDKNLTQVTADYIPGGYYSAGRWDYTPTGSFTSQATNVNGHQYGDMKELDTWKHVGDDAITRWETSVKEKLIDPAEEALKNLATAWGTSHFDLGSISTKGDKGIGESYKEDKAAKEKKDAEDKAAKEKADAEAKYAKDKKDAEDKAAKEKAEAEAKYAKDKKDAEAKAAKEKAEAEAKAEAKEAAAEAKAEAKEKEAEAKQAAMEAKQEEKEKEAEAKRAAMEAKQEEKEKQAEAKQAEKEKQQEEIRKEQEAKQEQMRAGQEAKQEAAQHKQEQAQQQAQAFQMRQANQQKADQDRREKEQEKKQAAAEAKQEQVRAEQEKKQEQAQHKQEEAREKQEAKQEQVRAEQEAKQEQVRAEQEKKQEQAQQKQDEIRKEQEAKQEAKEQEAEKKQEAAQHKQEEVREKQEAKQEQVRAEQEKKQEQAQHKQEEYQQKQQQLSRQLNGGGLDQHMGDAGGLGQHQDISGPVNGDDSLTNPGGSESHLDSQGRVVTEFPDGSKSVVDPHSQMSTVTRPDGTSYSGPLNAGDLLNNPDGSTTHLDPQGQVVTEHPDGSTSRVDPDTGATSVTSPDGTTTTGYLNDPSNAQPDYGPGSHQMNGGGSPGALNTPSYDYGDPSYEEELYDDSPYREPSLGGASGGSGGPEAAEGQGRGSPLNSGPMPGGAGAGGSGGGMPMGGMPMGGMGGGGGGGGKGSDGPSERVRNVIDTGEVVSNRRTGAAPRGKGTYEERQAVSTSGASPFLPMGGGAGQGQTETESGDREREVWEPEDDDVWGTDEGGSPAVIGR
ncbi:AAWKG family protein [Streptomyces iconiensis]|uniref:AAWKG family protein n=1 Tax=Streptomyces iconiensis TaxID=1384038 RepID=A0ABT7A0Q0_9ACTN|nr:AAWKG family protein [Streptomyces iconiensis]MDJ1134912.1 AAWKG family protein [Streptomyces iconiensis]